MDKFDEATPLRQGKIGQTMYDIHTILKFHLIQL